MDKLVMSKDRVVARFDSMNHLVWKDEALCPFYLKRTGNLDGWLASRAIDSHRPNSRLLKKALRLAVLLAACPRIKQSVFLLNEGH